MVVKEEEKKTENRLMVNRNCQTPESIMFIGETQNECEYNLYYFKKNNMFKCELFYSHRCIEFYEYAGFIKKIQVVRVVTTMHGSCLCMRTEWI